MRITQQRDSDLDYRTFHLGDFSFGELIIDMPDNRSFYTDRIDLTETHDVFVDITAGNDVATGEASWELRSVDPATGNLPVEASIAFLPPNLMSFEGEGFATYSVRPKSTAETGAIIDAEARIVFDFNEPVDTPPIFNTLDAGEPKSQIETLPVTPGHTTLRVNWSGEDDVNGSGLADYSIFVSTHDGPYVAWLENTFVGERGRTYAF